MNDRNSKIPEWFALDKYDDFRSLLPVEFALNLAARVQIFISLENRSDSTPNQHEYAQYLIEQIKINPILHRDQLEDIYQSVKEELRLGRAGWYQGAGLGVVTTLPLITAYEIYQAIEEDTALRNNVAGHFYHSGIGRVTCYSDWYENVFNKVSVDEVDSLISVFNDVITIDTTASDEHLIEGFKDWLKTCRATEPCADEFGGSAYKPEIKNIDGYQERLIKAAVLPFLDLRIFEKVECVKLPLHKIGDAIFPENTDVDTSEAVRKTTRGLARHSLRNSFLFLRKTILNETQTDAEEK